MAELATSWQKGSQLSKCQEMDFIERFNEPGLPARSLSFFEGDAMPLLRNIDT
jgi:hypothetical protein